MQQMKDLWDVLSERVQTHVPRGVQVAAITHVQDVNTLALVIVTNLVLEDVEGIPGTIEKSGREQTAPRFLINYSDESIKKDKSTSFCQGHHLHCHEGLPACL